MMKPSKSGRKVPTTKSQVSNDYRACASCAEDFAPVTSDADDRYSFCSPECERRISK